MRAESVSGDHALGEVDLNGSYVLQRAPEGRIVVSAEVRVDRDLPDATAGR